MVRLDVFKGFKSSIGEQNKTKKPFTHKFRSKKAHSRPLTFPKKYWNGGRGNLYNNNLSLIKMRASPSLRNKHCPYKLFIPSKRSAMPTSYPLTQHPNASNMMRSQSETSQSWRVSEPPRLHVHSVLAKLRVSKKAQSHKGSATKLMNKITWLILIMPAKSASRARSNQKKNDENSS